MKEFSAYYFMLSHPNVGKGYGALGFFKILCTALIVTFSSLLIFGGCSYLLLLYIYVYVALLTTSVCNVSNDVKPSVTLPISYKKRTVYYYLSLLLFGVVASVIAALVALIFFAPTIATMEGGLFENLNIGTAKITPAGYIFAFSSLFYFLGADVLITRRTSTKQFWVRFAVFAVVTFVSIMLLFGASLPEEDTEDFGIIYNISNISANAATMWTVVSIIAAVSVAVFILSVIWVVKIEKPKKF